MCLAFSSILLIEDLGLHIEVWPKIESEFQEGDAVT